MPLKGTCHKIAYFFRKVNLDFTLVRITFNGTWVVYQSHKFPLKRSDRLKKKKAKCSRNP